MTVTDKLLRVYRVDRKIEGLQSRLRGAEQFLGQQNQQIEALGKRASVIESQIRQLKASQAEAEGEAAQHDEHIAQLRERMNSANTNKEYKALLAEVNTFKEKKAALESSALEMMEKIEKLEAERIQIAEQGDERAKVKTIAESERAQRADEIRDQLETLKAERTDLVKDVPASALQTYEELVERLDEDAMAAIEIADRRRHEFHCGACMMLVPVEAMSSLLSHGSITQCPSCGCILFLEEKDRETMTSKK
jgi:predicted  nucleic acid-binding Zn-ribbon protein